MDTASYPTIRVYLSESHGLATRLEIDDNEGKRQEVTFKKGGNSTIGFTLWLLVRNVPAGHAFQVTKLKRSFPKERHKEVAYSLNKGLTNLKKLKLVTCRQGTTIWIFTVAEITVLSAKESG